MAGKDIEVLIKQIAKLPSLGSRSARRIVLHLLDKRETAFLPLIDALNNVAQNIKTCEICGNFDTQSPCPICTSTTRDDSLICVVRDVADLWAMERVSLFKGKYHVLGGVISPMDGVGPGDLEIDSLVERVKTGDIKEVILALSTTMEGDTTNFYIYRKLEHLGVKLSVIARGISIGDELEYTDEVTLGRSIVNRMPFNGIM